MVWHYPGGCPRIESLSKAQQLFELFVFVNFKAGEWNYPVDSVDSKSTMPFADATVEPSDATDQAENQSKT